MNIVEGYGLTEATCLVSCNPIRTARRSIGSVGIPFPYTDVKILRHDRRPACANAASTRWARSASTIPACAPARPIPSATKNRPFVHEVYLRTGDLGRIDADGYIWITGRAKDLIIRGGHNIDPAQIEEALAGHEAVAFVGAIGQPDAHAGELPCAYVELVEGADGDASVICWTSRAAGSPSARRCPSTSRSCDELPKTAVGKVFKPELRMRAIMRVYNAALAEAELAARVVEVMEDKKRGLVARLRRDKGDDEARVAQTLGSFTRPWEWAD